LRRVPSKEQSGWEREEFSVDKTVEREKGAGLPNYVCRGLRGKELSTYWEESSSGEKKGRNPAMDDCYVWR